MLSNLFLLQRYNLFLIWQYFFLFFVFFILWSIFDSCMREARGRNSPMLGSLFSHHGSEGKAKAV